MSCCRATVPPDRVLANRPVRPIHWPAAHPLRQRSDANATRAHCVRQHSWLLQEQLKNLPQQMRRPALRHRFHGGSHTQILRTGLHPAKQCRLPDGISVTRLPTHIRQERISCSHYVLFYSESKCRAFRRPRGVRERVMGSVKLLPIGISVRHRLKRKSLLSLRVRAQQCGTDRAGEWNPPRRAHLSMPRRAR